MLLHWPKCLMYCQMYSGEEANQWEHNQNGAYLSGRCDKDVIFYLCIMVLILVVLIGL